MPETKEIAHMAPNNAFDDLPPPPARDAAPTPDQPDAAPQPEAHADAAPTAPQAEAETTPPPEAASATADTTNNAPPPPRGILRLGIIRGDLRIQPWQGEPATPPHARLRGDDFAYNLTPDAAQTVGADDDAVLYVAGLMDIAIAGVEGDLVATRLPGTLDVTYAAGDARLDQIAGSVALREVHGDATARTLGDDCTIVSVQGDVHLENISGVARLDSVHGDANLRHSAQVEVTHVHGDLRAQNVAVVVVDKSVHGDVTLAQVERATLRHVNGDLTAIDVGSFLQATKVDGDVRLRAVSGQVRLAEVAGDLAAQDLAGGIIAEVEDDAYLETRLVAGQTYQVTAGSVVLRARSPISAQFVAQSEGGEIRTQLPLTVERHRQALAGVIGQGEATVTLTSTHGDIILDAAGAEDEPRERGKRDAGGFRVHVDTGPGGPRVDVSGIPGMPDIPGILENLPDFGAMFSGWPFGGESGMTDQEPPRDYSEFESRMRDIGERTGRAARKAAEKFREYTERAARRARETDWEAVSRDMRGAFERTVGELEATFREIRAEFDGEPATTGEGPQAKVSGKPTAQRITIEQEPVDSTATPVEPASPTVDVAARRRAILEQVRAGDLTLEEADKLLGEL
jgi:DUF4097 and DUF4098 domain-containing protein YvlB